MNRGTVSSGAVRPVLCFCVASSLELGPVWQCGRPLATVAPEGCFTVTAASRGGSIRQLIVFKAIEFQLQRPCPVLHANLRCVYNRAGPIIACAITTPRRAAVVRALLKPAEWFLTALTGGGIAPSIPSAAA